MRHQFIYPGKTREKFLAEGAAEYLKRLKPLAEAEEIIVKAAALTPKASPADCEAARRKEAEAIWARLAPGAGLVALDLRGRVRSSEELAEFIGREEEQGRRVLAWAVGGPWGLAESFMEKATLRLSLGPMTYTHELARLLILEQVYRAQTILAGLPYHK